MEKGGGTAAVYQMAETKLQGAGLSQLGGEVDDQVGGNPGAER